VLRRAPSTLLCEVCSSRDLPRDLSGSGRPPTDPVLDPPPAEAPDARHPFPLTQRWSPERIARGLPQRNPDEPTMRIWRPTISELGFRPWNSEVSVTQWDPSYPQKGVSRRCHRIVWESRRCWCPQRDSRQFAKVLIAHGASRFKDSWRRLDNTTC